MGAGALHNLHQCLIRSEWGHSFRPSYLKLGDARRCLAPRAPILAMTGSATRQVKDDIKRVLGLRQPVVITRSSNRPEIAYEVISVAHYTVRLIRQIVGPLACVPLTGSV